MNELLLGEIRFRYRKPRKYTYYKSRMNYQIQIWGKQLEYEP
jgi:hypothetical protein